MYLKCTQQHRAVNPHTYAYFISIYSYKIEADGAKQCHAIICVYVYVLQLVAIIMVVICNMYESIYKPHINPTKSPTIATASRAHVWVQLN